VTLKDVKIASQAQSHQLNLQSAQIVKKYYKSAILNFKQQIRANLAARWDTSEEVKE